MFDAELRYSVLLYINKKKRVKTEELKQNFDYSRFLRQDGIFLIKSDPDKQYVEINFDGLLFLEEYHKNLMKRDEQKKHIRLLRVAAVYSMISASLGLLILYDSGTA